MSKHYIIQSTSGGLRARYKYKEDADRALAAFHPGSEVIEVEGEIPLQLTEDQLRDIYREATADTPENRKFQEQFGDWLKTQPGWNELVEKINKE